MLRDFCDRGTTTVDKMACFVERKRADRRGRGGRRRSSSIQQKLYGGWYGGGTGEAQDWQREMEGGKRDVDEQREAEEEEKEEHRSGVDVYDRRGPAMR